MILRQGNVHVQDRMAQNQTQPLRDQHRELFTPLAKPQLLTGMRITTSCLTAIISKEIKASYMLVDFLSIVSRNSIHHGGHRASKNEATGILSMC